MIQGILTGGRGLSHLFRQSWIYIWANILWIALSLPIVTAPAAWCGLCRMSYYAHRRPTAQLSDFWDGFRAHWRGGVVIGLIGALLVVINVANLINYRYEDGIGYSLLRLFWTGTLLLWFAIQLYAFPLLNAMTTPTLPGAYRNAAVMALHSPLFTLGVWLVALAVLVFTILFPAAPILISGGAWAAIGNAAVQNRLRAEGFEETPEAPTEAPAEPTWDGVS